MISSFGPEKKASPQVKVDHKRPATRRGGALVTTTTASATTAAAACADSAKPIPAIPSGPFAAAVGVVKGRARGKVEPFGREAQHRVGVVRHEPMDTAQPEVTPTKGTHKRYTLPPTAPQAHCAEAKKQRANAL